MGLVSDLRRLTASGVQHAFYLYAGERLGPLLEEFRGTQWLSREQLADRQWRIVREVVRHAFDNIPAYRHAYEAAGVRDATLESPLDLARLPPLTRAEAGGLFADLPAAAGAGRTFVRKTSGSSGEPLKLVKDARCLAAMDAIMYRNYEWYGVRPGDRVARFWLTPRTWQGRLRTQARDLLLNRVRYSPFELRPGFSLKIARAMRRHRPRAIYGYAQTLYRFASHLRGAAEDLRGSGLECVIVTAEMSYPDQRALMSEVFGCPVVNEYGCTEAGVIAMQCPEGNMHLALENLLVEIVNGEGVPVPAGRAGSVLVTELYSRGVPLIRYRVGDRASLSPDPCECGRGLGILGEIRGRDDDHIVLAEGSRVDAYFIQLALDGLPRRLGHVLQSRVVQRPDRSVDVYLVVKSGHPDEIDSHFKRAVGREAEIGADWRVTFVDSLPLAPSGKSTWFVSEVAECGTPADAR